MDDLTWRRQNPPRPPSDLIAERVEKLETTSKTTSAAVDELRVALCGPPGKPEDGALWKVARHDSNWKVVMKVYVTLLTAVAIGLAGWVAKISWMVQSAKVGP